LIPQVIHHIIGPKSNPVVERCLNSWKILERVGFKIKLWDDQLIESFLKENYIFALKAFLGARNHAEAADIARYLIIYHFGGHYIDWDVELLDPDKYLKVCKKNPNGYFIIDPLNDTLASEVFATTPRPGCLMKLTKDIVQLFDSGEIYMLGTPQYSGPFRMRDSLHGYVGIEQTFIDVKSIYAYDYTEIRNRPARKITQPLIHYWLHSWL
jgi:hypothetical protein